MNVQKEIDNLGITDVSGSIEKAFIAGFDWSAEGSNGEYNRYSEGEINKAANKYIRKLRRINDAVR